MICNIDLSYWLDFSYQISKTVNRHRAHVSLILRKRNTLLSIGTNEFKTHPKVLHYGYHLPYMHSELDAFRKLKNNSYDKLTLLNFRFSRTGVLGMSKPCVYCMPWCYSIFDRILYSDYSGSISEFNKLTNTGQVVGIFE